MNNVQVVQHKQRLDALFDKAAELTNDAELLSNWAKYLCVLASGFIEASVRTLIREYVGARANREVSHYVSQKLRRFQNAKMSKILDLLGDFSSEMRENLDTATKGELKDAIDSVVSNRHQIAHGGFVGMSYVNIKDYYDRSVQVIEKIEDLLGT